VAAVHWVARRTACDDYQIWFPPHKDGEEVGGASWRAGTRGDERGI